MSQSDANGNNTPTKEVKRWTEKWQSSPKLAYAFVVMSVLLIIFIICNIALMATVASTYREIIGKQHTITSTTTKFEQPTSAKQETTTSLNPINVCETSPCKEAAQDILASLNRSVDPCEDFYAYSCTGTSPHVQFHDTHQMPNDIKLYLKDVLETVNVTYRDPISVRIAVNTYRTCVNPNVRLSRKRMEETLREAGPCIPCGDSPTNKLNWRQLYLKNAYLTWGMTPFIDFTAVPSAKGKGYTLAMDSPKPLSHLSDSDTSVILEQIAKCFFLNEMANTNFYSLRHLYSTLYEKSRKHQPWNEALDGTLHLRTLDEIIHRAPDSVWKNSLNDIAERVAGSNFYEFVVKDEDYVKMLGNLENDFQNKLDQLASNYTAAWFLAKTLHLWHDRLDIPPVQNECENLWEQLHPGKARWESCLEDIYETMPHVLDHLYAKEHDVLNGKAEDFVNQIENAFRRQISLQSWMDDASKHAALSKVRSVVHHIGYPHWILDDKNLDDYYKELPMPTDDLLQNYVTLRKFHVNKVLEKASRDYRTSLDWPEEDVASPMHRRIAYLKQYNTLVFSAGSQVPPLYHPNQPGYLNFGAAGTRIGHMLAHLLEDKADDANQTDAWSLETLKEWRKRQECIQKQYEDLFLRRLHRNENRSQTLSEDVADNIGLRIAHLAYTRTTAEGHTQDKLPGLENFSSAQMFFMAYATGLCEPSRPDPNLPSAIHSPAMLRVLGPVYNMPEFSEAFGCGAKDVTRNNLQCKIF